MTHSQNVVDRVVALKRLGTAHRDISEQVFGKRTMASTIWYILNEHYYNKVQQEVPKEFPKILSFDIETAPEVNYTWGRWKQNVGVAQVIQRSFMLTWAAKWLDNEDVLSDALPDHALYGSNMINDLEIVKTIWALLDEADIVVAHNGVKFDLSYLYARFAYHGLPMPSPYKVIDTMRIAKRYFRFGANSLAELAEALEIPSKKYKTDFDLWKGCLAGDPDSWNRMVEYNRQDVVVLEQLYLRLRSYDKGHPNVGLYYSDDLVRDPVTGSSDVVKLDKLAYTAQSAFETYRGPTGHTFRTTQRVKGVKTSNVQ